MFMRAYDLRQRAREKMGVDYVSPNLKNSNVEN